MKMYLVPRPLPSLSLSYCKWFDLVNSMLGFGLADDGNKTHVKSASSGVVRAYVHYAVLMIMILFSRTSSEKSHSRIARLYGFLYMSSP